MSRPHTEEQIKKQNQAQINPLFPMMRSRRRRFNFCHIPQQFGKAAVSGKKGLNARTLILLRSVIFSISIKWRRGISEGKTAKARSGCLRS